VSARGGFTLLELLVAIVLAGVLALLVYGAAGAGFDTQERLAESRAATQSARAIHAVLTDALRNARPGARFGDTAFVIEDGRAAGGRPADRLSFITSGATPPLTPDVDWRIVLESTGNRTTLTGSPLGMSDPPSVILPTPGISGLDVRVLPPGARRRWAEGGIAFTEVPRAVEITWWSDTGVVGLPVRVVLPWGAAR
jgi:prepilin-type N-terminal cleavage/methylation domain-containing protein